MFITKKHLSRRTLLRGAGAAIALPLLDSMIPARTALAQTAAAPKTRLGCIYIPHGVTMDKWTPATTGSGFELTEILQPARAGPRSGLRRERPYACAGRTVVRRRFRRRQQPQSRRGRVLERRPPGQRQSRRLWPQHRSDSGGSHRPRHADTLDRAGARAGWAQLRQRQHLRLHQHAGVEVGDAAVADGAQPAGGVLALVRPRRHRCRARGAAHRSEQRARLGARASRRPAGRVARLRSACVCRLPRGSPRGRAACRAGRLTDVVRGGVARCPGRRARRISKST